MIDSRQTTEPAPLHPPLVDALRALLSQIDLHTGELDSRLRELECAHGPAVYAELIHLLSHLRFEGPAAKEHWSRILEHRLSMQRLLDSPVDLRLALFGYFMQIDRRLSNPKVIEVNLFDQALASVYMDELTGLRNYRYLAESLPQEILRSAQYGQPLTLAMLDVDDFKHYNDRNGHPAGNAALATLARLVSARIRRVDVAARFGGEEFALVLPSTPKAGAELVAERLRVAIESEPFEHGSAQPGGRLTVSLGLATYPADADTAEQLVRAADEALYAAKAAGKNRLRLYGSSSRSHRRIETEIDGRCRLPSQDEVPLSISQIGAGGMQFSVAAELAVGSVVETRFALPGAEQPICVCGRILSVDRDARGRHEAAMRFIDLADDARQRLAQLTGVVAGA